jgi:pilus assembly protein CpaB
VIFGLIAAVSVSRYLASAKGDNLAKVVVAAIDIPLGEKIIAEQLTIVQLPRNAAPEGTFDAPATVIGRVTAVKIAARETITEHRLAPQGAAAGLSAVIPEGYRAMTVKVDDEAGIAGFLRPGTLVDVLVVIEAPNDNSRSNPISKIVLQNIKVLASGQDMDQPQNEREAVSVKTVTLLVTPDRAEKLALASSEGKLRLALRNYIDQNDQQTRGATKQSLLTGESALPVPDPGAEVEPAPKAPRPANSKARRSTPPAIIPAIPTPTPPPRIWVEVWEGGKRRAVDFP